SLVPDLLRERAAESPLSSRVKALLERSSRDRFQRRAARVRSGGDAAFSAEQRLRVEIGLAFQADDDRRDEAKAVDEAGGTMEIVAEEGGPDGVPGSAHHRVRLAEDAERVHGVT